MTKTAAAFLLTADRLFQPGEKVYFWTFTFFKLQSDSQGSRLFSAFLNHLRKVLGGDWGGVKVAELHKEHGIHFHALINRRLAVDIVRRVARCYGLGRMFVERAWTKEEAAQHNRRSSPDYLCKYLVKQREGPKGKNGRSVRRWSAFGPVQKTRISDLVNDSPFWIFRREHNLPFLGFSFEHYLRFCWLRGEDVFKSAWFAAKKHGQAAMGILAAAAEGRIYPNGQGEWCTRFKFLKIPHPLYYGGIPQEIQNQWRIAF